jgi:hypothetical protein
LGTADQFPLKLFCDIDLLSIKNLKMSVEMKQTGAVMTAAFSRFENKQKYVKSTYVPPHQRSITPTVSKPENKFNGGKKQNDFAQSFKLCGFNFTQS